MIRETFLLLLILGFCIALEDPPVDEVVQHNQNISAAMVRNAALTFGELTRDEPARVNMTIVTVLPAVDGRIPAETEGVLWAWNEKNADGQEIYHEGEDGCTDTYRPMLSNYSEYAEMNFRFRNESLGGQVNTNNPIVEVPFDVALLETANGTENLTIEIEWNFWYDFDVIVIDFKDFGGSCQKLNYTPMQSWDIYVIGNTSADYLIEPGKANFFLVRPVLGEQWYQNNHFDTLIFSRKSIYKAEISMDGNESAYARIYDFSVLEDPMGAWHITVNETRDFTNAIMENYELSYWANPVVREDTPFSHLYEVNYSYGGWGPHWMNITVTDFFLGEHTYAREILSRKITRQGMSETGEPAGSEEYYRPGEPELEETGVIHHLLPSNEIIMVFLVASLWMFWHYSKSGKSR
ncbi:MAG: hypothetical protein GY852_08075 [bacterium]|nr:hypothetical protein [bacterium]